MSFRTEIQEVTVHLTQRVEPTRTEVPEEREQMWEASQHSILLGELKGLKKILSTTKQKLEQLQSHCTELERDVRNKDSEIQELQKEHSEMSLELQKKSDELSRKDQQYDNLFKEKQASDNERKRLQEELRQKEEVPVNQPESRTRDLATYEWTRTSAAADIQIQQGGDHDRLLIEFESLATDFGPDGILGTLEQHYDPYEARVLLCETFQYAYNESKKEAVDMVHEQLQKLFTKESSSDMMDYTRRAYGMLLHATSARKKEDHHIRNIINEVSEQFPILEASHSADDPQHAPFNAVNKIVRLAWRFVTLPCPLIVCQPSEFDQQLMDQETHHWDDTLKEHVLVYTDPVVYRSYHGIVARKGAVGNAPMPCEDSQSHEPQTGPPSKTI